MTCFKKYPEASHTLKAMTRQKGNRAQNIPGPASPVWPSSQYLEHSQWSKTNCEINDFRFYFLLQSYHLATLATTAMTTKPQRR